MALRLALAVALFAVASLAHGGFHFFRIHQIFSNADGSVQFVVLRECCGRNGEHRFDGQMLVATSSGIERTFVFPSSLPSSATANKFVLIATQGFADLNLVVPDFVIPAGFIPVGGGTLNFAGASAVTYGPLPTDGVTAITAAGTPTPNVAANFGGQTGSVVAVASALAVEFRNAGLDHYFVSHIAKEIEDLDKGVHPGWTRTGLAFRVFTSASARTSAVCRFYIPPAKGDSHFYGRGAQECSETAQKNPTFVNEDPQFFHVVLPAAGVCPADTINVYRVFNGRPDANHRYTTDAAIRDLMESQQKWIAEGDGPQRVVMCVPPSV
jgi:hypothetical protein